MTNILIIGATGSVGSTTRDYFLNHTNDNLTLMARNTSRLGNIDQNRETAIKGDATKESDIENALNNQDVVFVAVSGNLPTVATAVTNAMERKNIDRLLFITSMGIYNEIPDSIGSNGNLEFNPILSSYRKAADIIESTNLNYTIIRPGWFQNSSNVDYEITKKGEPFGGHDVTLAGIADLVVNLSHDKNLGSRDSLGVNNK